MPTNCDWYACALSELKYRLKYGLYNLLSTRTYVLINLPTVKYKQPTYAYEYDAYHYSYYYYDGDDYRYYY